MTAETVAAETGRDFIRDIVQADLDAGKYRQIVTRFPPEPNGYLHIGHAKSIALNFGIAQEFAGRCHLRFDDTNPTREEQEYIDSIQADVRWLGYDWGTDLYYASDYFERLYEWAEGLIKAGHAYVDDQSQEEIRVKRGTLTEPGKNSPFRDRSVEENLDLFRRMKAGEFPNGARVLRAKIDMASGNINLRDPVLYRILHATHPRTGDAWSIYPSYDYAHGQSDAIEGITHSICTLEFEDHRPLYEWLLEQAAGAVETAPVRIRPAQPDLHAAVEAGADRTGARRPRRRLGRSADADHRRAETARRAAGGDPRIHQAHRRGQSQQRGRRRHAGILHPRGSQQVVAAPHGGAAALEGRDRELSGRARAKSSTPSIIPTIRPRGRERSRSAASSISSSDDFMEVPPKKFFRLSPGTEVRLRYAYFIKCTEVIKDAAGEVVELRCTYDPATKGGNAPDGRKVKATMHWLSAAQSQPAEIRIYNPLFAKPNPDAGNFAADLNPQSLEVLTDARIEPAIAATNSSDVVQFERQGYFVRDPDSTPDRPVFTRTIGLRDTFAKEVGGKT